MMATWTTAGVPGAPDTGSLPAAGVPTTAVAELAGAPVSAADVPADGVSELPEHAPTTTVRMATVTARTNGPHRRGELRSTIGKPYPIRISCPHRPREATAAAPDPSDRAATGSS